MFSTLRQGINGTCRLIKHSQTLEQLAIRQFSPSMTAMKDKKLFTPGPLGVTMTVRESMLRDLGSRDTEFIETVKFLRSKLLEVAGVPSSHYTAVPVQGSGTYAVEAVFQTFVPRQWGKVLILENGAYGKRMGKICSVLGISYQLESFPENDRVNIERVEEILKNDSSFTNIAIVHCETSSGVINPIEEVGQLIKKHTPGASYLIDAMSSFGAIPIDVEACNADYVVSSANKCIQGVPGFSYAICHLDNLLKCRGNSRSLSLDLVDQYENLEKTSQFRFTPPTHTMLAFKTALLELEEEGGVEGRAKRYKENRAILREGMKKLGFKELLDDSHEGYIITSYHYPKDKNFDFKDFYTRLNEKNQVIYPGKVLETDCFRIGNIGDLHRDDMRHLLTCIEEVCVDMKISLPVKN